MLRKQVLAFFCFTTPLYPIVFTVLTLKGYELFIEHHWPFTFFFLAGYYYVIWEFNRCENISEDDKLFWSQVINAIILPAIFFKINSAEQRTQSTTNAQQITPQTPTLLSPVHHALLAFFCAVISLYLVAVLFRFTTYLPLEDHGHRYLRGILFIGFNYVMMMFWSRNQFSSDDKLFWTLAVLFAAPIGLPLLYFKKLRTCCLKPAENRAQPSIT